MTIDVRRTTRVYSTNPHLLGANFHGVGAVPGGVQRIATVGRPYLEVSETAAAEMDSGQVFGLRGWGTVDHLPIEVVDAFGDLEGCRFLDVGSSSGAYVIGAAMMGAEIAVGADLEPPRVAMATELARIADAALMRQEYFFYPFPAFLPGDAVEGNGGRENVFFEVADAAELAGFRPDYFDAINCLFLLNFLPERDRVRPVDFLVGAAGALRSRMQPIDRILRYSHTERTLAEAVRLFVGEEGGDEKAVADVAVNSAEESLLMRIIQGTLSRDELIGTLRWRDSFCCRPLPDGMDSSRMRTLIRMLEVIRSGGRIQAESELCGIPCKDYTDGRWITLYGFAPFGAFSFSMIPMVKTIDLLRLAAGVLHARSGINITITETPSTLSRGVSIFQVMKA